MAMTITFTVLMLPFIFSSNTHATVVPMASIDDYIYLVRQPYATTCKLTVYFFNLPY